MTALRQISSTSAGTALRSFRDGLMLSGLSIAVSLAAMLAAAPALAVDSVWLETPVGTNYFGAVNWDTGEAPVNAGDTAIFGPSAITALSITGGVLDVDVDSWIFNANADDYVFTNDQQVLFHGEGIVINGGTQTIINNAGGLVGFLNDSSAGDAVVVNNGELGFGGVNASAGNATITNNGILGFEHGSAGNAAITNNNVARFIGVASADSATITTSGTGTTEFSNTSTASSATLIVEGGGVLEFQDSSAAGGAAITNAAVGEVVFLNDSTADSAVIGNDGRIRFLDNSTAGTATISNNALATETLFFGNSSAANATINNNGLLGFAGNSTAADATITNSGTIQWINDSSAGNATIVNEGLIQLSHTASLGYARLINAAGATVDISAILPAFGTTVGSIEGAGDIILGDRGLLTGLNDLSTEFSGTLSGVGGALGKVGEGTLTLSGVSTYTGETQIANGTLIVNGSIADSVFVSISNGTLGGTGTVATVFALDGSTVAPGNSIGTLNVAGDVTFDPGSVYEVEVNSLGQSDLIDATGTATLNGGTVEVIPFPDFAIDTQYTILTAAAGVGGAFDGADFASASLFLTPTLTYGANDVFLTIARTADFDSAALTPNQIAAAAGAQSLGGGELFNAIAVLGTEDEARAAFDAISGEIHASAKTALIEDSRFVREAAAARLGIASEGLGFWTQAFGASGHTDSDGNAASLDRSTGGVFIGADGEVFDGWQAGVLAGYSRSGFNVDDRASSGSANSYHLGAYGGTAWNDFAARFGGAYSWHDLEVNRTAAFTGFFDSLSSSYSAATGQLFGEVSYGMDVDSARFEPFANLAWVSHATNGFTENGGAAALTGADDVINATFTTLGLRASTELVMGGTSTAKLTGMIGWRHAFGDVPTASNTFVAGGDAFTVAGVPLAQDALILEAGLDLDITPDATLGFVYSGQLGSGISDHSIKANLGVRF
ncbi:autotransporter domain-containing protein [Pelagibacterium halotolerans]|uniref:autotransporter outer membrane beta-barrel domain-containing protein n=1 Tax=Pelagibacterium halotolerans TaxID=531813 RepID=UPI0038500021